MVIILLYGNDNKFNELLKESSKEILKENLFRTACLYREKLILESHIQDDTDELGNHG